MKIICFAAAVSAACCLYSADWDGLPSTSCVVRVNGEALTKARFEESAALLAFALESRFGPGQRFDSAYARMKAGLPASLVAAELFRQAAAGDGVVATPSGKASVRRRIAASFGKGPGRYAELRAAAGVKGLGKALDAEADAGALYAAYMSAAHGGEMVVGSNDVVAAKAWLSRYNATAAETNRLISAEISAVLKRVRAGTPFEAEAKARSREWDLGVCDESDFEGYPGEYWAAVSALPEGGMSGPLDTPTGTEIVMNAGRTSEGVRLFRIAFRKAYLMPEQPDDELVSDIAAEKAETARKKALAGLLAGAEIEYPYGKELFGTWR